MTLIAPTNEIASIFALESFDRDKMTKTSKLLMFVFLIYPLFRNLLGIYNAVWVISMLAGLLLALRYCRGNILVSVPMVAWMVIGLLSVGSFLVLGADATGTPKRVLTFTLTVFLMLCLSSSTDWIRPTLRIVLVMLSVHAIATIVFLAVPTLYTVYFKPRFFPTDQDAIGYQSGLTAHYSYNGMLLSAGLLLATAELVGHTRHNHDARVKSLPQLAWVILFAIALLATTKRGPLIAVAIALIVTALVGAGRRKFSTVMKVACVATVVVLGLFLLIQAVPQLSEVFNRFSVMTTGTSDADVTNGRNYLWDRAIELWRESPIVGHGWWTFRYYWAGRIDVATSTAHNVFLNILSEVGIAGLLIYLFAAVPCLVGLWKIMTHFAEYNSSQRTISYFAFSYQIFFFIYSISGSPLYDVEGYIFYLLMSCGVWFGICTRLADQKKKSVWLPSFSGAVYAK